MHVFRAEFGNSPSYHTTSIPLVRAIGKKEKKKLRGPVYERSPGAIYPRLFYRYMIVESVGRENCVALLMITH